MLFIIFGVCFAAVVNGMNVGVWLCCCSYWYECNFNVVGVFVDAAVDIGMDIVYLLLLVFMLVLLLLYCS